MATSDIQLTVLQIINKVERRLEVPPSSTISSKHTLLLLDLLNEVIDEVSDYGDWPEMYREVNVTGSAGQSSYKVTASAEVKNILEISHSARGISPLEPVDVPTILRLQRLGSTGTPSQFAVVGVSGTRPLFRPWPIPNSSELFRVAFYEKPPLYTSADASVVIPFPSNVLYTGLYAKMVANEAGGESTAQYQTAYAEHQRAKKEALNRYTSDTGSDIRISPGGIYD